MSITVEQLMNARARVIDGELDYRDTQVDLYNVDDMKVLDALQKMPQYLRQLYQDESIHITLNENNKIVRIIKRRDDEFLFNESKLPARTQREIEDLPLAKQWEERLREDLAASKEDVFDNPEVEVVPLEDFTTPRDKWDLLFDATNYIREVKRFSKSKEYLEMSKQERKQAVNNLADKLVYSSDWFPYLADKRIKTPRAKKILSILNSRDVSKQEMLNLTKTTKDVRMEESRKLYKEARSMKPGEDKAFILKKAGILKKMYISAKSKKKEEQELSLGELKRLWEVWRDKQVDKYGKVKLPEAVFRRMLTGKLQRTTELSSSEIKERVNKSAQKIYKK